jgi:hypothetical protein
VRIHFASELSLASERAGPAINPYYPEEPAGPGHGTPWVKHKSAVGGELSGPLLAGSYGSITFDLHVLRLRLDASHLMRIRVNGSTLH